MTPAKLPCQKEGGVITPLPTDHIGRSVFGTNTAGTKVWTAAYHPALASVLGRSGGKQSTGLFSVPPHPFGGVRTTTGTPINLRFPGQWFQSESGLHQNWMRDYDPTTGRYLQADPLGLVDGASVYGYALQNPVANSDPKGEQSVVIRPGIRLGPGVRPWGPRGWFDVPPLVVPRETTPENFVDHPVAKEEYRKYKQFCNAPPPNTGDRCTDLLNKAEYLFRCANMKDNWDKKWLPGRHKEAIAQMRDAAKNYLSLFAKSCASCPIDELPMSKPENASYDN
jgi:RHS repeat-associated protein